MQVQSVLRNNLKSCGLPLYHALRPVPLRTAAAVQHNPNLPQFSVAARSKLADMAQKRGRTLAFSTQTETVGDDGQPSTFYAQEMLNYINAAWTPFHAVEEASKQLLASGFQHINEKDQWAIQPGGKYFFTRNMSTIVAFAVGKKYEPGNGFYMIGAHTDSPCPKLKPVSKGSKSGYLMVNVECYGGGLWTTWFDRDLSVAGRVLLQTKEGKMEHRLVKIEKPIMRIPMLAIHLNRTISSDGFKPNLQTHFQPVLATGIKGQVEGGGDTKQDNTSRHHALLLDLIAKQLSCSVDDIVDFELNVVDIQPGTIGGIRDEFVFSGRLDNLTMSFLCLRSLIDACKEESALDNETGVRAIALFDHEEVGSTSMAGAGGPVMRDTITRISRAMAAGQEGAVERTLRNSFLVSADMAHALHPNYSDKHDPDHQPRFHGGLVVKHNHNQRYATNAVSASLFREIGRRAGVPCQEFCVRNDSPCGSTIGPVLSALLGCRTVDVGVPQMSMHSVREMCGTDDVALGYKHFLSFFQNFSVIDATLDVDTLPPPHALGTVSDLPCCDTA